MCLCWRWKPPDIPAVSIPYTLALPTAVADLAQRLNALLATLGLGESQTRFVDAKGFVNVRSCGGTQCGVITVVQDGDPLDVVNDEGEWYEIRLPGGGTGFIAAFLVSDTPPG